MLKMIVYCGNINYKSIIYDFSKERMINIKKKSLFLFVVVSICIFTFAAHTVNHNTVKQDIDLSTAEWNTIYTINRFHNIGSAFFGIINDGNNDDEIYVRVLDRNNNIVFQSCLVELGEQKELDFMKDGYIIQAKSANRYGNFRICIVNKGMIV